jgi:hypothetical protein
VLIVSNTGNFEKKFDIVWHGRTAQVTVPEESVVTYEWQ